MNAHAPVAPSIGVLTIGRTETAVSIIVSPMATLAFDLCGRPIGLCERGFYYARGLDGRWLEKKWLPGQAAARHIRALTTEENAGIKARVIELLKMCEKEIPALIRARNLNLLFNGRKVPPTEWKARRILRSLLSFNIKSLDADAERFKKIYKPVGILPPDQYLSFLVQMTEGCPWNRCTFCAFYTGTPARVKSREEILRHACEAAFYFGSSLAGRCSIFLGDANVFQAPPELLVWTCETLSRMFARLARPQADGVGGIYAFGETVRLLSWPPEAFRSLQKAGLRRVYIGLESGADPLRRWVQKPGTAAQALDAVKRLKSAGINAGLIVLVGLGGKENARVHAEQTVQLLRRMPLDARDIVYFSPLRETPYSEYNRRRLKKGWTSLTEEECREQMTEMKQALADGACAVRHPPTSGCHAERRGNTGTAPPIRQTGTVVSAYRSGGRDVRQTGTAPSGGRAEPPKTAVYDVREFLY